MDMNANIKVIDSMQKVLTSLHQQVFLKYIGFRRLECKDGKTQNGNWK